MSYVLSIPLVNSIDAELDAVAVDINTGLPVDTALGNAVTDDTSFSFQVSTDGGSNYNTTITSSSSHAYQDEADSDTNLRYWTDHDQAQGTSFQNLMLRVSNDNDHAHVGTLQIFNPSSTTFAKHFISRLQTVYYYQAGYSMDDYIAGYANTTSAINAVQFKMTSGNIDAGVIKLYGVS